MTNPAYLTGIHTPDTALRIHTNAGTSVSKQQGYLGSQKFWLDRFGIANVISLQSLESRYKVSYDSTKNGGAFIVHVPEGDIVFKRCPETSFPYVDLDDVAEGGDKGVMLMQSDASRCKEIISDSGATPSHTDSAMLIQTIRGNYEGFTKREVIKAREMQEMQGRFCHHLILPRYSFIVSQYTFLGLYT
jgi:hypothetical protein